MAEDILDRQAHAISWGDWPCPEIGGELSEEWVDSFLAIRLADVLSRRYYGVSFKLLSVEDRCKVRGDCESFIARMTWINRKRNG